MPESPQWLITQGRFDAARECLKRIAKWNGVHVDEFEPFVEELHKPGEHKKHKHGEDLLKPLSEV